MAWFKCMGGEINPIYEEEKHTLVYTLQAGGQWEYFTNPNPASGLLLYEVTDEYNNVVLSIKKKTDDLEIYGLYTTIGVFDTNKSINVARTSDDATIYVSVNTTFTGYHLKVYTFAEETGETAFLKGTSDISSTYGSNGMIYLKYLDIEQFYNVKEYIAVGTTAGPYINTGLTTSSNVTKLTTEAEITYSYTDRPDNNTWMFGAFSGYGLILGYQNGQTEGYVGSGGLLTGYDTDIHTIQFKNGSIYADDVLKQTGNWTQIPDNVPIYIFSRGGDNPVIKNTRIYRCKIWQNGELLRDFIPVQRKSDDEIGMLDIINNVFYTNDGTGSFSCGGTSEITQPIIQSYVKYGTWKELMGENIDKVNCASIPLNCTILEGSFTTGSTVDSVVIINCGFEPDFIKVLMDFGSSQTTAYYFKTGNADNEEISVWDLRPTEGAIYQIFEPSGPASSETGICEVTSTGFKYKAHGGNTTSKACTFVAYKFEESLPVFDEDAFYQYGTWLHPEDMTMLVTGGAVDASGNLYFDSTTDICGVSTDDLIDEGKYKYIFYVRNMSSNTLTAQFGSCTPGYTTQQIIGTGQGRGAYASATVAPDNRGVFVYDVNHAGGTAGVFAGMYPTNNPWQIEKILRIPIT